MATSSSLGGAGFGRKPDYAKANDAIDSILSHAVFDQRRTALRQTYKQAEQRYQSLASRELARGRALENRAGNLQSGADVVAFQNRQVTAAQNQLKRLNDRWNKEAQDLIPEWTVRFVSDPERNALEGKARKQAWNEFYQRQAKHLDIYQEAIRDQKTLIRSLTGQAKGSFADYQRQQALAKQAQRRYKAMTAQRKRAFEVYDRAVTRYNAFANYVPYNPA